MAKYKFLKKKTFEKIEDFETRVNEMASQGWRAVSFNETTAGFIVLFEKDR